MRTIPETEETIAAQLEWLAQGRRRAVLLTPGTVLPELPAGCLLLTVPEGVLIFTSRSATLVHEYQQGRMTLAELLGYGTADKPANPRQSSVVVIRQGANGHEKQSVACAEEELPQVQQAARALCGEGDTVSVENGARVLEDRLRALDARELKVRPFAPGQDGEALERAAAADRHYPLHPTHVVERHGEIVGYFGVSSLPLYRLWFDSGKVRAGDSARLLFMIENHYRMAGIGLVGTIINTASPFYPVAARGGYVENQGDRLFLKEL